MNTNRMVKDYIQTARDCLEQANQCFQRGNYNMTVRRAQECVEMSLKATLRLLSIEYPYRHDVGDVVESLGEKNVPKWFLKQIPEFAEVSRKLSEKRGPAMYGYESELKPATEIFDTEDAKDALESADKVFKACEKIISEFTEK